MSTVNNTTAKNTEPLDITDGAELKRVLRVSGYSQREIAMYMGYSRSYVNNVCNGLSPLTLRVIQSVRDKLGSELYRLAIVRARQVKVDEERQWAERQRFLAMEEAYQREQKKLEEEKRRNDAIASLKDQIEGGEVNATQNPQSVVDSNNLGEASYVEVAVEQTATRHEQPDVNGSA